MLHRLDLRPLKWQRHSTFNHIPSRPIAYRLPSYMCVIRRWRKPFPRARQLWSHSEDTARHQLVGILEHREWGRHIGKTQEKRQRPTIELRIKLLDASNPL